MEKEAIIEENLVLYGDITNAKCEHLANFSPVIT
jgi:hypothetical protein